MRMMKTIYWNENVIILTKFVSLAATENVILTTSGTASEKKIVKNYDIFLRNK